MGSSTQLDDAFLDTITPSALYEACMAFPEAGSPAPSVVWSPKQGQFLNPLIEQFANRCRQLCRIDGQFYADDLDLDDFGALTAWIMVIRIDQSTQSLVYAHYGSGIADHFGRDMTGLTTDHFSGHIAQFFAATYREIERTRQWVLTEHEPPSQIFVCAWRRLLLPLISARGDVTGFIGINVPESPLRTGLDMLPEPIFVLNGSKCLMFANSYACDLFDLPATQASDLHFREVTGIDLDQIETPDQMFAKRSVENRIVKLRLKSGLEDDFLLTISAAVHSRQVLYILMIRPVLEH